MGDARRRGTRDARRAAAIAKLDADIVRLAEARRDDAQRRNARIVSPKVAAIVGALGVLGAPGIQRK